MKLSVLESMITLSHHMGLNATHQMFAFMKMKHNVVVVFEPPETDLDLSKLPRRNW